MKELGRSRGGAVIMEFTREEAEILRQLVLVSEGYELYYTAQSSIPESNIHNVLVAINRFIVAKHWVGRLEPMLNDLKRKFPDAKPGAVKEKK